MAEIQCKRKNGARITARNCVEYRSQQSSICRGCKWNPKRRKPKPQKQNPEGIIRDMKARLSGGPPKTFADFVPWFINRINEEREALLSIPEGEAVLNFKEPNEYTRRVQSLTLWGNVPSCFDAMADGLLSWVCRVWKQKTYEALCGEGRKDERAFLDLVRLETLCGRFPAGGLALSIYPGGPPVNPHWPLYLDGSRDGFRERVASALNEKPNTRGDMAALLSFVASLYWPMFIKSRPKGTDINEHAARLITEAGILLKVTPPQVRKRAEGLGLSAK
ncbi:MAG: hypothetical protein JRJ79_18385, partial [Deltaproteobacteria bacterium]|nr:hypothetical protein [Deltaproteobacteria bacterium]